MYYSVYLWISFLTKIQMNKLKVSQVQFSASHLPNFNSKVLEKNFNMAIKFQPHLICTPECSNIITNDKNYLMLNAPYQNSCPVLKLSLIQI